jgi:predicted secreted protein
MIQLKPGETHKVWLEKEGVGGYTWVLATIPTPDGILVEKCIDRPNAAAIPGASVGVWYAIHAVSSGKFHLCFELKRAWETEKHAIKKYELDLLVI